MVNRNDDCSHPPESMLIDVHVDERPPCDDTPIRRMRIFGHCMACHQRVQFVGVPFARGIDVPTSTPDALEARIPYLMVNP